MFICWQLSGNCGWCCCTRARIRSVGVSCQWRHHIGWWIRPIRSQLQIPIRFPALSVSCILESVLPCRAMAGRPLTAALFHATLCCSSHATAGTYIVRMYVCMTNYSKDVLKDMQGNTTQQKDKATQHNSPEAVIFKELAAMGGKSNLQHLVHSSYIYILYMYIHVYLLLLGSDAGGAGI